jgi:hypothetical protein
MNLNPGGVTAAERQPGGAEPDFHRVAQRGEADDFQLFAFEHAHVEQPLDQGRVALQRQDAAPLAGPELVEGRHAVTP